jgi:hypothetical protein
MASIASAKKVSSDAASSKPAASLEIDDVCILRCREVFVYKIPTRRDAARGHRADQWGLGSYTHSPATLNSTQ